MLKLQLDGHSSSITRIAKCCNFRWHAHGHTVLVLGAAIAGSPNLGSSTECERRWCVRADARKPDSQADMVILA